MAGLGLKIQRSRLQARIWPSQRRPSTIASIERTKRQKSERIVVSTTGYCSSTVSPKGLISALTASNAGPGHLIPKAGISARLGTRSRSSDDDGGPLELCLQLIGGDVECGWGCPWPWVRANSTCSKAHYPSCVSAVDTQVREAT